MSPSWADDDELIDVARGIGLVELARRVTDAVSEVCKLPREAIWVVFNEVTPPDWYVAGNPGKK